MALNFREKMKIQKAITSVLEALESDSNLSFREKIKLQKDLETSFKKLEAELDKKPGIENETLSDLLAGKYNDKTPEEFLFIVQEVTHEIKDIEPVKEPVVKYINENQDLIISE